MLLIPSLSWGLTFKSDGSVVDNDGNEIQSSRKNEEVDSNTKNSSQRDIKGIKFNISNSKVKSDVIFYKNGEEVGIKIDDLFEKINKCSIIHLDIEGHETHALLGAKKIINHFKPLLILESAINNPTVKDLLIMNKYKFIKKVNDNFILKSES